MTLAPTTPCASCGAPMYWAVTESGKRIPLDPDSTHKGNLIFDRESGKVRAHDPLLDGPCDRFVSHFASCPHADAHRRKR